MVRIIHITTVPESLQFIRGQLGYFRQQGAQVSVVSSPGDLLDEFQSQEGIPTEAVEMRRQITPFRDLIAINHLTNHLVTHRPSIVHAHTPKAGLLGMIAATLARVPIKIYHIRGLPFITSQSLRRTLLKTTEQISCRLAHRVFAVSHSMKTLAVENGLCNSKKLVVFGAGSGNGVDAENRFNPNRFDNNAKQTLRTQYGIPSDCKVIGFVGRIVRDKGICDLANAWQMIRQKHPSAHLLLTGYPELNDPVPPDVLEAMESDPHVHFTGPQSDTARFYAASDIVTLPTYREGFPNVLLEAAAMSKPVVATKIPGCVDAVVDGVTGTLVPTKNSVLLSEAICGYLSDPGKSERHGELARQRVLAEFRPESIWKGVWKEYVELLEDKGLAVPSSDQKLSRAA